MEIGRDILVMCNLVAFAENEKQYAISKKLQVEDYAVDVLERFRKLYPDAELLCGDTGGLTKPYVRCKINGTWEFASMNPFMIVSIKTDGSIDLDEGTAEVIFKYDTLG